jgi:hypothetical protein
MTKEQARALLALMADLYLVASAPEPKKPIEAPISNGDAAEPVKVET